MSVCELPSMTAIAPVGARRGWWESALEWVVDARSRRVISLVIGIWILNAFDLAFTVLSHEQGMLHESNPVASFILSLGTPSIVCYKIGLVLLGSYPLLRFRSARIAEMAAMTVLIVYAMLAVRWSSCYELYTLSFYHTPNLASAGPPIAPAIP